MRKDIEKFIKNYKIYYYVKPSNNKYQRLLKLLPILKKL